MIENPHNSLKTIRGKDHLNGWSFCYGEMNNEFNYKSIRWKKKRQFILRRDNYECQICRRYGRKKQATTVHHIKHTDESPELAFENSNLISVCESCHNELHPEKGGGRVRHTY